MRRTASIALFLALFPLSCSRDGALKQALVGTWTREIDEPSRKQVETMTFLGNGSCVRETDTVFHLDETDSAKVGKKELPSHSSSKCQWDVKDKKLIRTYESPATYVTTQSFELENTELRVIISPKLTETFKKK